MIMAGTIGYERDQRAGAAAGRRRTRRKSRGKRGVAAEGAVDGVADHAYDVAVVALVAAADIVGLADAAALDHGHQRVAVIRDVQPIPDVRAVAIDRQRL